ncbi:uncharacterized protein PgNI_07817 [Pyricularia grisea]|uniref:Peptidase S8/S53 domain-containing protein n=1 Tax=Pyricularia grisea TaxID=148305 RepID=A0A6P8B2F3_PYRGI|nr:uncharacterized protein PgNI_07817 [Pyricularia grisea]TLD08893.1 hypothetical protein PgNI_07817 [Pyricularia grisea]
MVRTICALALAGIFSLVASAAHTREPTNRHSRRAAQNEASVVKGVYMVELDDSVTPDQLTDTLSAANVTVHIRQTLKSRIFNGVSLDLVGAGNDSAATEGTLLAATGVKQIWPVRTVSMPKNDVQSFIPLGTHYSTPHTTTRRATANDTYYPHVMAQVDRLHDAGITGLGVRIAVVDTGVDYDNPILGGCLGANCIVTHGWDSVGVDELLDVAGAVTPVPDDDPMDCAGHGMHVAGIVAALPNEFGFLGAAPGATLGAYRVMDCSGYGTEETIAAGMLRAFDDGNHILTLSMTASRIVEAGVPVFVAIGNTGETGSLFDPVAPADARHISSVSSFDPVQEPAVYALAEYVVDDGKVEEFEWVPLLNGRYDMEGSADEQAFPLIDLNSFVVNGTVVGGCQTIPDSVPDLSGYLVLVERTPANSCIFRTQRENIKAKGGNHMMFWASEDIIRSIVNDDLQTFIATTTPTPATEWRNALSAGSNVTVTLTNPTKSKPKVVWTTNNKTGGYVSSFSSWGPTLEMQSAPVFGGPGRSILSTYLHNKGQGVATLGGTSMAAPFVAASAALLLQAHNHTLDPPTLQTLLSSTAIHSLGNPHPLQAGAGLVQLWDAAHTKGVLSAPNISFNDSDHHVGEMRLALRNTGDVPAVYSLSHTAAATIYAMGPDADSLTSMPLQTIDAPAAISFSTDSVSVPAGGEAEIAVRCTPPQGVEGGRWPIYSGYLQFNGSNGDVLSIPYVGNAGSMRRAVVLTAQELFVTPRFAAGDVVTLPSGEGSSSSSSGIVVTVYPRLPTRVMRYELVEPTFTNATGVAMSNSTTAWLGHKTFGQMMGSPQAVFAKGAAGSIKFTGLMAGGGRLGEGRYAILVSVLRLFGDPDQGDVDNWQTVETVPFELRYSS